LLVERVLLRHFYPDNWRIVNGYNTSTASEHV
jgi:hypothetical protein